MIIEAMRPMLVLHVVQGWHGWTIRGEPFAGARRHATQSDATAAACAAASRSARFDHAIATVRVWPRHGECFDAAVYGARPVESYQ